MNTTRLFSVLLLSILTMGLQAQDAEETTVTKRVKTSAIETTTIEEDKSTTDEDATKPLLIFGSADLYYQYSFNESPLPTSFTETHNSFTLGMANIIFSKEFKHGGFVADIAFGSRADVANGAIGLGDLTSTLGAIKQLYITFSPIEDLTFTAGNFGTHVGYEVIDPTGNFNYSTSYMFSNGPFYHTGLKADYAINENLGVMVGVFNETDAKFDLNNKKHIGAQVSAVVGGLDVYVNYLGGSEGDAELDASNIMGHQFDLTATYTATKDLLVGVNATNKAIIVDGVDDNLSWAGAALYLNYQLKEKVGLGFRGEYFMDNDGVNFGTPDLNILGLTLSANLKCGPITFIPEFRLDSASEDIFTDKDGGATGISPTVLGAAVYAF